MMENTFRFERIRPSETNRLTELTKLFAREFDDERSYLAAPPTEAYLRGLLLKQHFIALVALAGDKVVAGLVAYVLDKFEQERSEVYIYDLAVLEEYRRRGIARSLILELKRIARELGAWVIYVQADKNEEDLPARQLYESMGEREDVFHYDIAVNQNA